MMAVLKEAVEKRKAFLIQQLHRYEIFWTPKGQAIENLPLVELERMHIEIKCENGSQGKIKRLVRWQTNECRLLAWLP